MQDLTSRSSNEELTRHATRSQLPLPEHVHASRQCTQTRNKNKTTKISTGTTTRKKLHDAAQKTALEHSDLTTEPTTKTPSILSQFFARTNREDSIVNRHDSFVNPPPSLQQRQLLPFGGLATGLSQSTNLASPAGDDSCHDCPAPRSREGRH
jgi:hypothetical protein